MEFIRKLFRRKPRQPNLKFAAEAFSPIAIMQINNIDADYYAIADGNADALRHDGCTDDEVSSARWGAITAIGQDLSSYQSGTVAFMDAYEETALSQGYRPKLDNEAMVRAKHYSAATMFLTLILADAPGEYERFLRYIDR